eukprot:scaffold1954_cov268-Pinguiococcus_pyrenoidosus.AAC.263
MYPLYDANNARDGMPPHDNSGSSIRHSAKLLDIRYDPQPRRRVHWCIATYKPGEPRSTCGRGFHLRAHTQKCIRSAASAGVVSGRTRTDQ